MSSPNLDPLSKITTNQELYNLIKDSQLEVSWGARKVVIQGVHYSVKDIAIKAKELFKIKVPNPENNESIKDNQYAYLVRAKIKKLDRDYSQVTGLSYLLNVIRSFFGWMQSGFISNQTLNKKTKQPFEDLQIKAFDFEMFFPNLLDNFITSKRAITDTKLFKILHSISEEERSDDPAVKLNDQLKKVKNSDVQIPRNSRLDELIGMFTSFNMKKMNETDLNLLSYITVSHAYDLFKYDSINLEDFYMYTTTLNELELIDLIKIILKDENPPRNPDFWNYLTRQFKGNPEALKLFCENLKLLLEKLDLKKLNTSFIENTLNAITDEKMDYHVALYCLDELIKIKDTIKKIENCSSLQNYTSESLSTNQDVGTKLSEFINLFEEDTI